MTASTECKQAVILAGGRGTRLAPLTDTRPKPMVEFHDKPFLEYLVSYLKDQGFEKIVMLLGYLPEVITDYFGDGSRFGIPITYSITAVENDTGARVLAARPLLDPIFFLIYCDNYCPVDFRAMWARFKEADASAMVTIYDNKDHHSRDNILVGDDGFVAVYDKKRQTPGLKGVDIGFIIMKRDVLDLLPEGNISLEAELYPRLIERHGLMANVVGHRYYSVGSIDRLEPTRIFLARRPTIFLDRDGVLNERQPKATYVKQWSQWRWLPGVLDALKRLNDNGWRCIVITNQAGIARGELTEAQLADIHTQMRDEAAKAGGHIEAIYHCPHGWDEECECRKPKPGMLFAAQRDFHLDLSRTPFAGDDDRDGVAAVAAGCPFAKITDDFSLAAYVDQLLGRD